MDLLLCLAPVLLCLCMGMAIGKTRYVFSEHRMTHIVNVTLCLLLFFMGLRIGRTPGIENKIIDVGYLSLCIAGAAIAGTIMILLIYYQIRKKGKADLINPQTEAGSPLNLIGYMGEPLKLLAFIAAGFCSGFFLDLFPEITGETTITVLLYLLLVLIGIQVVKSPISFKQSFLTPETLILPIGTIIGSLLGALIISDHIGLPFNKTLSLASGFGWYSLSGVIITDMGDPVLGSAGFLVNIFRESIALVMIPLLGKTRFPNIAIGVAGATSMDVTLPLLEKSCGPRAVPLSITSGSILSLLVPILVPLFFQLQ